MSDEKVNLLKSLYARFPYPGGQNHDSYFENAVFPWVKKCQFHNILEAGCGTGDTLSSISKLFPFSNITAIDFSESSLKAAKKRISDDGFANITFHNADIINFSAEAKDGFDFIHCQGVLHHLDNPKKGLSTLVSLMNDDGYIFLWVYTEIGRRDITDIQSIIDSTGLAGDLNTKLTVLKNLLKIRSYCDNTVRHKRYLGKPRPNAFLIKLGRGLIRIGKYGIVSTLKVALRRLTFGGSHKLVDIGLVDEYLNPIEYFYDLNEFYALISECGLDIVKVIDGVSESIDDAVDNTIAIHPALTKNKHIENNILQFFEKPRGVGVLCKKALSSTDCL